MNIALVPANQVPKIFSNRIKSRQVDEAAFVTSMSAQFYDNPITQSLAEFSSSNDTFVLDYFGHWHGAIPARFMSKAHQRARDLFQSTFQGAYIVAGPPPRINLTNSTILNRSHVKAYVVGSRILSLGGVNCVPASYYDFIDVMLDFESDRFASYLHKLSEREGNLRQEGVGEEFWLDDHNKVIVDYGRRNNFYGRGNESLIMNSLLNDLEKDLSAAVFSSTYIPYGKLDDALYKHVQKGHKVTFYTNKPSKFNAPYCSRYENVLQKAYALKAKTPWLDTRPDKLNHLKAAILTHPDGNKIAYIGSHNFHELPVWAGTAEVCLRSIDSNLIGQLEQFIQNNLVR